MRFPRLIPAIGVALALQGLSLSGTALTVGGRALAASPGAEPAVKVVQVNADLSLHLDRLERRATGDEVYDLFSKPAPPASSDRPAGKPRGKHDALQALPPPPEPDQEMVSVTPSVVLTPPNIAETPIAAPVTAPAPPPPPPPPVLAPVVAAPPPPKPPAIPFVYMGKLEEGERTVYFLVKGEKLYMVKAGDDIDEAYTLEGVAEQQLRLLYKPLRIAQTLTVGP